MKWAIGVLLLFCGMVQGATSFTYTSSAGIKYEFSIDPETAAPRMMATLDSSVVMQGNWVATGSEATFNVTATNTAFGTPTGFALSKVASNSVRVTQEYDAFKTVTTWKFTGEDALCTFVISNTNSKKAVEVLELSGMTVNFAKPVTGFLPSWHWTWLQAVGKQVLHPSLWVPVGAVWASDDTIGFSAYTQGRLDRPKLIHADFIKDGVIPETCKLQFFIPEVLEIGQTKTFDLHLRISKDRTWQHLLQPYKTEFTKQFPAVKYKHQEKPLGWFSAVDLSWVRDNNPLGFGDNNGTTLSRRLDKPEGVNAFLTTICEPLRAANAQGCIFWLWGVEKRGAMYRPDFDVVDPSVTANWPALSKGFHDRGLMIGVAARPGEVVERIDWEHDDTSRISASSRSQVARLENRFRHVIDAGIGDMFYLDTFGSDYNDLQIMRQLRKDVLGDRPVYAEYATDVFLVEGGRYMEYRKAGGYSWIRQDVLEVQRWLVPGAGFIVKSVEDDLNPGPLDLKAQMKEDWKWVK